MNIEQLDPKESLRIFETDEIDKQKQQKFIMANVTYILKDDSVLMMVHTKDNSVTDGNHVGTGGKYAIKTFSGKESEKIPTKEVVQNIMSGKIPMEETLGGACREIKEETNLDIDSSELKVIGFSHIKLKNEKINEIWNIVSYVVEDYKGEINIDELNKNSKEGIFKLVKLQDIENIKMAPADRIIFNNREKKDNIYVEVIYDELNAGELRYVLNNKEKEDDKYSATYILIPDLSKPKEYIGEKLEVDAESLENCSILDQYKKSGNSIENIAKIWELKTMSYLPGVESNVEKFSYPMYCELLAQKGSIIKDER